MNVRERTQFEWRHNILHCRSYNSPAVCTSRRCLAHPIGRIAPQFAHRYPNTKNTDRKSKTHCKIINLFFLREDSVGLERMHAILSQKQDRTQRGQQQTLYKQQQSPHLLQPTGGLNVSYWPKFCPHPPVLKLIHEYICLVLIWFFTCMSTIFQLYQDPLGLPM